MADYITYLLALIVTFLGIFAGAILALIAPEELKAGEKYWKAVKYVFVSLLIITVFYFSIKYSNIITAIILSLAIIFLKLVNREYPAFAFILFFSTINADFLIITSSLIFIYGFLIGTLDAKPFLIKKLDKYKRIDLKKVEFKKIFLTIIKNNILYLIFGLIILPLLAYL